MRILLTGATGFIGSALLKRLLTDRLNVRVLALPGTETSLPRDHRVQVLAGALADLPILDRATRGVDVVFHLAGLLPGNAPARLAQVNVEGTQNVAHACARNGVRRLVFASSTSVYRDSSYLFATGIAEEAPLRTLGTTDIELYGLSKVAAERRIVELGPNGRPDYVIVRAPLVYGMADGPDKRLINAMRTRPLLAASRLMAIRTMQSVHIHDLVQGLVLAGTNPAAANQAFNMAGAELFSPRDAAQLQSFTADIFDDGPVTHPDLLRYDIRKARSELGYAPLVRFGQRKHAPVALNQRRRLR